jgi:hypothetical protein
MNSIGRRLTGFSQIIDLICVHLANLRPILLCKVCMNPIGRRSTGFSQIIDLICVHLANLRPILLYRVYGASQIRKLSRTQKFSPLEFKIHTW